MTTAGVAPDQSHSLVKSYKWLSPIRSPSHGENRGSSPLGSASNINDLR